MFDFVTNMFRRREYKSPQGTDLENIAEDMKKVIPFPEAPKSYPPMPEVKPPAEEKKPAQTYYRLGFTDDNRVSFQMGYSEITMNKQGVDNLIKQLAVFRDQLAEVEETDEEE